MQDPGGGEFSGIQIFCVPATDAACISAVASKPAGTLLNISGPYIAFTINVGGTPVLSPEIAARDGNSPVVTVPGGTTAAVAAVVPASQVSTDFDVKSADFQRFHQVLVKVNGPATVATVSASSFDATVGAKTIFTDIAGFFGVTWCGAAGCGANEIHLNDVFSSMTGVIRIASQKTQFAITKDADLVRQ